MFEEYGNVVCVVIISNPSMKGIKILKEEALIADSIIKLNYVFTLSEKMVEKFLFKISDNKKDIIKNELLNKLN